MRVLAGWSPVRIAIFIGVWRSMVARMSGGHEVVGSKPTTPTMGA